MKYKEQRYLGYVPFKQGRQRTKMFATFPNYHSVMREVGYISRPHFQAYILASTTDRKRDFTLYRKALHFVVIHLRIEDWSVSIP